MNTRTVCNSYCSELNRNLVALASITNLGNSVQALHNKIPCLLSDVVSRILNKTLCFRILPLPHKIPVVQAPFLKQKYL